MVIVDWLVGQKFLLGPDCHGNPQDFNITGTDEKRCVRHSAYDGTEKGGTLIKINKSIINRTLTIARTHCNKQY